MCKRRSMSRRALGRREFLKGAAAMAAPLVVPSSVLGLGGRTAPSQRITIGLIGHGEMGQHHLARLVGDPSLQVLAVCDVDRLRRQEGQRRVEATYAASLPAGAYRGCAAYNDYRELLARPDIDAVVIVTPDHWHALQAIDAAKAGKDIYCEKPVSLTIQEGRQIVDAVRRSGRVFQTGTQYRSNPTKRKVCQFIREGRLGRIKSVFTPWHDNMEWMAGYFKPYAGQIDVASIVASKVPVEVCLPGQPVPEGLDWDLWVGPAPWQPYHPLYHRNPRPGLVPWSWSESFGAASITWVHSHSADVIQYALGVETSGPVEIIPPATGRFPTLTCKYASGVLLHHVDVYHWDLVKTVYKAVPSTARLYGANGGLFVGERGWVLITGGQVQGEPEEILQEMKLETREIGGADEHYVNWLDCIRTRCQPSASEELGHRAASLGHLVVLGHRLQRSLRWDPAREEFIGDDQANRLRSRAMREPWRA